MILFGYNIFMKIASTIKCHLNINPDVGNVRKSGRGLSLKSGKNSLCYMDVVYISPVIIPYIRFAYF